jgi:hypothetical protein
METAMSIESHGGNDVRQLPGRNHMACFAPENPADPIILFRPRLINNAPRKAAEAS